MSSILLPVELIQTIIDELHEDKPALHSCALVCHSWAAISQRVIFSSVCLAPSLFGLSTSKGLSLTTRFHQIASTSPHLLRYVRILEFDPTQDTVQYLFPPSSTTLEEVRLVNFAGDISKAEDVVAAMLSIASVTRLTVREGPAYPAHIIPILRHCPQLRSLTMSRVMLDQFAELDPDVGKVIQLRSITVGRMEPDILADLAENVVDLTRLRSFSAQFHPFFYDHRRIERSVPIVQKVLRSIEGTLEHLTLDIVPDEPLDKLINLSRLRSLELRLPSPKLKSDSPYRISEMALQWLLTSLESGQATSLESVILNQVPVTDKCADLAVRIDQHLGALRRLQHVCVLMYEKECTSANGMFPLLSQRGILRPHCKIPFRTEYRSLELPGL